MYIFAKFVADDIFLQNRDKIKIKKFKGDHGGRCIFLQNLWCYIGSQTLAPWPTVLAGLLPPWPTALGP
jgi:hypothetical protein